MHEYLHWNEQILSDWSDATINSLYNEGYLFTRLGKGVIHQTRSVRIDLSQFEVSSENRRILKKTDGLTLETFILPYTKYDWTIGKMAKDFYETKFGEGTFSANKIKELLTETEKSNFNLLFVYSFNNEIIGYCIARGTNELIHYSYPFYNLEKAPKDVGLGMMIRAIIYTKEQGKKYIYLGSAQRPGDTYKFQFLGTEWFDGKNWSTDQKKIELELTKV